MKTHTVPNPYRSNKDVHNPRIAAIAAARAIRNKGLRAEWLGVAGCYRVFFGLAMIDIGGQFSWNTPAELRASLDAAGLVLESNMTITKKGDAA